MRALPAVARADARNIARDPLLVLLSLVPLPAALIVRFGFPALADALAPGIDLLRWAPAATAMLVLTTPLLLGLVTGFMLLEERDEGVLAAVAVTPAGRDGFLVARLTIPVLWSIPATWIVAWIAATSPVAPAAFLPVSLLAALEAPMLPLFMGAFAANRLEGMALAKVGNLAVGVGMIAALVPEPWRWLGVPLPHFWPVQLLLHEPTGGGWLPQLGAAFASHAAVLALLAARFRRRTERAEP